MVAQERETGREFSPSSALLYKDEYSYTKYNI